MRDIHSHILPGVDDGARTLEDSLAMLEAAKAAGVTSIVCTPHCRDPYFDYDAMWNAFDLLYRHAPDFPLQMGFEVNAVKLAQLGMNWADYLHFDGSDEFLLELPSNATGVELADYERMIFQLQGKGYHVIIAHPERYQAVQRDIDAARQLARMGCQLQVSCDFISAGRTGRARGSAKKLIAEGLCSYCASDAHEPYHYECLKRVRNLYPQLLGCGDGR